MRVPVVRIMSHFDTPAMDKVKFLDDNVGSTRSSNIPGMGHGFREQYLWKKHAKHTRSSKKVRNEL